MASQVDDADSSGSDDTDEEVFASRQEAVLAGAREGDPACQFWFGYFQLHGCAGYRRNPTEARKWFVHAARGGHAQAMWYVGVSLLTADMGVEEKDVEKALYYLNKSADKGFGPAMQSLGAHYRSVGREKESFRMYFRACRDANHIPAFYQLGNCYENGLGTAVDPAKAFACYERAAHAGHVDSQYEMGIQYLSTERYNTSEAIQWLYKAAQAEHPRALFHLGQVLVHVTPEEWPRGLDESLMERAREQQAQEKASGRSSQASGLMAARTPEFLRTVFSFGAMMFVLALAVYFWGSLFPSHAPVLLPGASTLLVMYGAYLFVGLSRYGRRRRSHLAGPPLAARRQQTIPSAAPARESSSRHRGDDTNDTSETRQQ